MAGAVRENGWLCRGLVTVLAALLLMPALAVGHAEAQTPAARSIDSACPAALPVAGFADVDRAATHGFAVDCVVLWKVAQGRRHPVRTNPVGYTRADGHVLGSHDY
jgi:hypothetical protein